jgi:hypothetical protein
MLVPSFFISFLEVLKLCGLYRGIFSQVKLFFLTIPLYIDFLV